MRPYAIAVLLVGLGLASVLLWSARPPDAGAVWRGVFVLGHVLSLVGLVVALRRWTPSMREVLLVAVCLRVALIPMMPTLSDDGYRYIWDGIVVIEAGLSPYALLPSDEHLAFLHVEPVYQLMNSREYFSVYPPVAQSVFVVSALVHRTLGWKWSWYLLKGVIVLAELAGLVLIARAVRPERLAWYALNPLVIVETAGQGHLEGIVVLGLGLVVFGMHRTGARRLVGLSAGMVVATLTKLIPAGTASVVARRTGWAGVAAMSSFALAWSIWFWVPGAVQNVGASVGLFLGTLDQYALPYRVLKAAIYPLTDSAGQIASAFLVSGWAASQLAAFAVDDGSYRAALRTLVVVVVGSLVVTSTLHPWYFVPALFVLTLSDDLRLRRAVFWLSAWSSVTYLGYTIPWTGDVAMLIGWLGAVVLYVWTHVQGTASRTRSTVATRASSQTEVG